MLLNLVAVVVEPSGFTRRACGVATSVAPSNLLPVASTLSAKYHLPSFALTTRLPFSSVYTTLPASPLRNAFTFVVKSLPFRPSSFVKPSLPIPALSPVPGLPSRPSTAVSPSFAALSSALRVASSKPMFTTPFSSVEIAIPVFVVAAFVVVASAPVALIVPVPDLKCKPVVTATVLPASVLAL